MKNLYLKIAANERDISEFVLATVIKSVGSTPQKPGASALFDRKGLVAGTIGGGVLEARIQEKSISLAGSSKPVISHYHLDSKSDQGEDAWCGGRITVLIDPYLSAHSEVFKRIKESIENGLKGVLVTVVTNVSEPEVKVSRYWITENNKTAVPDNLYAEIHEDIERLTESSDPFAFEIIEKPSAEGMESGSIIILEPLKPLPCLVIAGAGHIGKVVAHLGKLLDFYVTVIDDRHEYANKENIPDADRIITDNVSDAIRKIRKTGDTYIVIVTRGHKDDASALRACICDEVAYIGMIGSKNKIALMRSEFLKNGWATAEQWGRIHAPIGLPINSRTVEEIAVSIAAQLVEVKNKKTR